MTFLSEASQILGLVGSHGILPIAEFIDVARAELSAPYRYLRLPTLFWCTASDSFIALVPWLGALASALVFAGVWSRVGLLVCYCLHQSTVVAGGDFYFYPWDFLLLETTLLALFVPTLRRLPSLQTLREPAPLVAFAIHFLLFRLQFGMGVHKFFNATDEGWRHLTAVHLWLQAQPMPTAAAWYAFNFLPAWFNAAMDLFTFVVEVPLPFFLLIPGRPRFVAAIATLSMHLGIALLGNFGTFQLISLTLCVPCLTMPTTRIRQSAVPPKRSEPNRFDVWAGSSVATVAMLCGLLFTIRMLQPQGITPLSNTRWLFAPDAERSVTYAGSRVLRFVSPFFLSYPYGIFRDSAYGLGPRLGFTVEGSVDGTSWYRYENKWSPVEPIDRAPQFFAPYQPRLDHLDIYEAGAFHFAYLNGINPYYGARTPIPFIAGRVFEQSADVSRLFARGAFPARAPVQLRFRVASYRFTSPAERLSTGSYWTRSDETIVGPVDAAQNRQLMAAERETARKALRQAVEVDEQLRASATPTTPTPVATAPVWMPAWKFWLIAAPGWLPLSAFSAIQALAWVQRRRRRWRAAVEPITR